MDNPNYGYVCFSYSTNEWIARSIAWFTKSKWSHTFFTVPDILGTQMAMEASSEGISMVPFNKAYRHDPNQKYEVYAFLLPKDQIDSAITETIQLLENPYGYLEYPWFIWRSINMVFGRDIKSQNNWSQQGTVCSGLSRLFIENAKLGVLFKDFGKDSANAQDVYNIVLSQPHLFKLIEKRD